MSAPFARVRAAALALLNNPEARLTRKAGQFLGQVCVDEAPLSEAQAEWLECLLDRNGYPGLGMEASHAE